MSMSSTFNPYAADTPGKAGAGTAPRWLDAFARAGYAARAGVYSLIGGLALAAAIGMGGELGGQKNALESLTGSTAGAAAIGLVALGLVGYSVWRLVQGVLDVDDKGQDAKGVCVRGGMIVSGIVHLALAVWAGSLSWQQLSGSGGGSESGGNAGKEGIAAWILGLPMGRWILGFVALCVLGAAVAFVVKAIRRQWEDNFALDAASLKRIRPVCRFGLCSRAVVFALIAAFIGWAAWTHDAGAVGGFGEAFRTLQSQAYGPILMGIVALGLMAFGVYGALQALYRRIDAPQRLQ